MLGDSNGQGSVVHCSPCGCRVGHNLIATQQQHKMKPESQMAVFFKKRNLDADTDMHRGKTSGPWKMTDVYKPERGGLKQPTALRRNQLCMCFDFGFLASRTVKEGASTGSAP